jgi:hypothetical protein
LVLQRSGGVGWGGGVPAVMTHRSYFSPSGRTRYSVMTTLRFSG